MEKQNQTCTFGKSLCPHLGGSPSVSWVGDGEVWGLQSVTTVGDFSPELCLHPGAGSPELATQ